MLKPSVPAMVRSLTAALAVSLLAGALPSTPLQAADAPTVIRLGLLSSDNSANVWDAEELGYFKAAGLDVQLTVLSGGPMAAQAVAGGTLDIGTGNVATIAAARLRGIKLKFFAPASVATPTTMTDVILVAKDSPYKTAADLDGKTIALNAIKALPQVSASSWMDKHGGDSKTVKFIEMTFPSMAAAVEAHRVDAALDVEPFVTNAKSSTRILGSAIDALGRFMILGYFADENWLNEHVDAVTKFQAALRRSSEWANTHRRESAVILAKHTKMDLSVINAMARSEYGTTVEPSMLQPIIDGAVKYGVIDKSIPASELIWTH